jgi:hypothetical protein
MSTVILDTITGKSTATTITIGSTPVVSSSANSMTIRGEGTAQTSIQQGLAKCWVNINGTGTPGFRDSFNTSSFTDSGAGNATTNFTNNMSNDDFAATIAAQDTSQRGDVHTSFEEQTTSTLRIMHFEGASTLDCIRIGAAVFGDLA